MSLGSLRQPVAGRCGPPLETARDHLTHVKDLDRFTGLYPIYLRLI